MKNLKTESIILAIGLVTAGLLIYFGFIGSSIRASAKAVQRSADFVAEHPTVGSFWSTVLSAFSEAYNAIAPLIRRAFD